MGDGGAIGKMLFMIGGLIVWAAHFTVVYGFTAVACAKDLAGTTFLGIELVPFVIGVATVLAWITAGLVLGIAFSSPTPPRSLRYAGSTEEFLQYTGAFIAGLSLFAITLTALPALVLEPCRY